MQSQKHIVKEGECLASIAKRYGFRRWQTIYEAAENHKLRKKRPNPNVLYAGDEIVIPEKEIKEEQCACQKKHRFKLHATPCTFRILMKDEAGTPLEDYDFELYVDGELVKEGKTEKEGLIQSPIAANAKEGMLIFLGQEFTLRFGMLDPVSTIKGVQQRLNNLGFMAGPEDGIFGEKTRKAVYEFQKRQGDLNTTGEIDDATRLRLLKVHDHDTRLPQEEQ